MKAAASQQDIFENARARELKKDQPLAARMRPRTLDEYVGQEHILAPGRLLRRAVQADQLSSLLFYGPPGTGKTTLASVIANTTKSVFITLNAVMAGIADLKDVTAAAQRRRIDYGQKTILFIDEVHRWNKAQQDALLPWVENGTVILIGATTENPYFTVNRALVSRSRIFQLKPLEEKHIRRIMEQALEDEERGYGKSKVTMEEAAMDHLANIANGDARAALNALELAVETTQPDENGNIRITMAVAEESIQKRAVLYDREGDCHFDTISAFIKSMRGSDPDATFYWLAKMVYAGEDPRFIFRRMIIFCSEDIGMADPNALQVVIAAAEAFDRVGMPEGNYPLSHAALYCATAPKSNSTMGFFDALKAVSSEREGEVPNHLRDASRDKEGFGHGIGYQYPHAYKDHWVAQQYLPSSLQGKIFYQPGAIGYEKSLGDIVRQRRELQLAALRDSGMELAPPEILTFTKPGDMTDKWLARAVDNLSPQLAMLREHIFSARRIQRHERILDLTADTGELTFEGVRQAPEGGVWSLAMSAESASSLEDIAANISEMRRPAILCGNPEELVSLLSAAGWGDVRFDMMVGRNLLSRAEDMTRRLRALLPLLEKGATISLAENLPGHSQRLSLLLPPPGDEKEREQRRHWLETEEKVYGDRSDSRFSWDENTLAATFTENGLPKPDIKILRLSRQLTITRAHLDKWFASVHGSYADSLYRHGMSADEVTAFQNLAYASLAERRFDWHSAAAIISITLP